MSARLETECRRCRRRREVARTKSWGGGSYKRPGRWYTSALCADCCIELLNLLDRPEMARATKLERWSTSSVESAAKALGIDLKPRAS